MPENEMELEEVEEEIEEEEIIERTGLTIQKFMDDMRLLGEQLKDRNVVAPPFNFSDLGVTNYLLWLNLGELMMLNDKLKEKE